jgi:hypothetical protein
VDPGKGSGGRSHAGAFEDEVMTVDLRTSSDRARLARTIAAVAALALSAACGPTEPASPAASTAAPTVLRTPDLAPDATLAPPQGKPLLTVTGRITATNADKALRLDEATLNRMGLLAMTVYDPWAKQRLPLQGVRLRDLVDLVRPDAGATSLHIRALDDYQVDLQLTDVRTQEIFLATRDGTGADLPLEDGGPTRVVFSDDLAHRFSPDLWIWNIDTIDVR